MPHIHEKIDFTVEPNKRESWEWYDLENIPEPLFFSAKLMIEAFKTGKFYNDK